MVKKEFITAVAEKSGMSKKDVDTVVDAISDVILEVIAKEDSVKLGNVCTFSGITKEARVGRNPSNGETINIPEKHGYPKAKFTKTAKA